MGIEFAGSNHIVSLQGVHLSGSIGGRQQRIKISQSYVNRETEAIEAQYTFPLPDGSAVCGFEICTNDRKISGKVEEKEKALERYDDAIMDGHGAYMLDQNRPDIFTMNAGNIKPLQAAEVIIEYIEEIQVNDKHIRLEFPTTVSPRYTTSTGVKSQSAMDEFVDERMINPPKWLKVPYGISMDLTIENGLKVKSVESSSHKVRFQSNSDGTLTVTLQEGISAMNRNIVLDVELEEFKPSAYMSRDENGEHFVAVNFLPEFEHIDEVEKTEVIFLVDCSGSMSGQSIQQAKKALELCIRTLNKGDSFNICLFGGGHRYMSTKNLVYNRTSMQIAMEFVSNIQANMGGTEIYTPLKEVLKRKTAFKNREIILLTDGQVSNEEAIIELARQSKKKNRIFSFGIGNGASQYLVKGLSRVTNGESEFISENERIEAKVLRTFSRLNSPRVESVTFDWYGADIELADKNPGPIFEGDFLTLYGRTSGVVPEEVKMTVAFSDETTEEFSLSVTGIEAAGIAPLWAFKRLRALEDAAANSFKKKKLVKQMVATSEKYSVMCKETSFIAIEERSVEERNDGMPQLRRIPVALTKDWGGIAVAGGPPCAAPAAAAAPSPKMRCKASMSKSASRGASRSDKTAYSLGAASGKMRCGSPSPKKSERKKSSKGGFFSSLFGGGRKDDISLEMDDCSYAFEESESIDFSEGTVSSSSSDAALFNLLAKQNANGLFGGNSSEQIKDLLGDLYSDRTGRTIEVLIILNSKFSNEKDIWARAAKKAVKALAKELNMNVDQVKVLIDEKSKQYQ